MAVFSYEAYDSNGRLVHGEVICASRDEALEVLARRNTLPVTLREGPAASRQRWWDMEILPKSALSSAARAHFTREMATLVSAGVPVDEALRIIAAAPELATGVKRIVKLVLADISNGASLAEALAARATAFPPVYTRMVGAAERGGRLGEGLTELAAYIEHSAGIRARLAAALVYPAVLVVAALVATGIVVGALVPALAPLFDDAGVPPPLPIRLMLVLGKFVGEHWLAILVSVSVLAVAIGWSWSRPVIRTRIDGLVLRLPLFGMLVAMHQTGRHARALSALLKNGVPMLEAMRIAQDQLTNRVFRVAAGQATTGVQRGNRLSQAMRDTMVFSDLAIRLTAIGEDIGQLEAMLARLAEICEATLSRRLERLASMIAPLMTILIGVLVGGIVLSVMTTIVSLNELAIR